MEKPLLSSLSLSDGRGSQASLGRVSKQVSGSLGQCSGESLDTVLHKAVGTAITDRRPVNTVPASNCQLTLSQHPTAVILSENY